MTRSILTIFFVMVLFPLCNGGSSFVTNDSISALYKGVPENGIFDKWLILDPIPVFLTSRDSVNPALQEEEFERDQISPAVISRSVNSKKLFYNKSLYKWKLVREDNGIIDLAKGSGGNSFAITYAYARIEVNENQEFIFGIGSDDAIKIWINGELILSNWTTRGLIPDDDLIHVRLKEGSNDIVVKIQNCGGQWAFTCKALLPDQYTDKLIFNTKTGHLENVKQLLKGGVDINCISGWGLTPLQTAYLYGQNKLVNLLLKQGADSTKEMPSKEKIVDAYFNNLVKEYYPGAAVLISKEGKILYQNAYGYENLENEVPFKTEGKFRIGSVSKQFTAAAILKLGERGLLNIDDKVSKYIPELPRGSEVSIHQLLNHSSGLQNSWNEELFKNIPAEFKTDDIISEFKKLKYNFNPGESWGYSNMGYIVLSMIIERVSGLSYYNFLKENFFEPLGMTNTGIAQKNNLFSTEILKNEVNGYYYESSKIYKVYNLDRSLGAGAIYSTLEDLFKWNEAIFNSRILSPESLKIALTPVQTGDGSPGKYGLFYGCGWFIGKFDGHQRLHHGGATDGFESMINRYVENNMTIIVFVNRFPFPPGINADLISQDIARIYLLD